VVTAPLGADETLPEAEAQAEAAASEAPVSEDEALAWLEGLAARQGVSEEELLTSPDERAETPPAWVEEAAAEVQEAVTEAAAEPAAPEPEAPAESTEEDLPEWLQGIESEAETAVEEEALSALLQDEPAFAEEQTADIQAAAVEAVAAEEQGAVPTAEQSEPTVEAAASPEPEQAVTEAPAPPTPARTGKDARYAAMLEQAREAMSAGRLPEAFKLYAKLIRKKRYLEIVVADLEAALSRYPVDVDLWQTLGDAYMRQGRLQKALDAYDKAEALLR